MVSNFRKGNSIDAYFISFFAALLKNDDEMGMKKTTFLKPDRLSISIYLSHDMIREYISEKCFKLESKN